MKYPELVKLLQTELAKFIESYQENPYVYLYESDIQAHLFSQIFDRLKKENQYIRQNIDYEYTKEKFIKTIPVKTEYPAPVKMEYVPISRFDIAFIDETAIDKYNDKIWKIWNNLVNICIEIKYWQPGERAKSKFESYSDDIKKLIRYKEKYYKNKEFLGIAILFVQFSKEEALALINKSRNKNFCEDIKKQLTDSEDKIELDKDDKIYNYIVFKDHINLLTSCPCW